MNYYFLPDTGRSDGVKVGCQLADLLNELGTPCAVVTPDGRAPGWLSSSSPVLSETAAIARLCARDARLFSRPAEYPQLAARPGPLVFHCQDADQPLDSILPDPRTTLLACWPQAADRLRARSGRAVLDAGLSVSDPYFYRGRPKVPMTVAFLPQDGAEIVAACRAANPGLLFLPLEAGPESAAADRLLGCEYFLATPGRERLGLRSLEAMAAGCVVAGTPGAGGPDFLRDRENCRIAAPADLPAALAALAAPGGQAARARLRDQALATATALRRDLHRRTVARLLADGLSFLQP